MPKKLTFEYIKEFINKKELLISTEYINSKEKLKQNAKHVKKYTIKRMKIIKEDIDIKNALI